jgi:ABC-type polysaccharide/polyol phosphate export permease
VSKFADTWRHDYDLFVAMVRMHYQANDYRFFLGFLWSFIGPVITFLALYLVFRPNFGAGVPSFGLRLLVGVLALNFFLSVVGITTNAVFAIREMVMNTRISCALLLVAPLCIPVLKFAVEMSICVVYGVWQGGMSVSGVIHLFTIAGFFCVFSFGVGLCLGIFNGLAADIGEIWQRIIPLFYCVTPIFYSLDTLGGQTKRLITYWNPLTFFVLGFQRAVAGPSVAGFDALMAVEMAGVTVGAVCLGVILFKRCYPSILES